MARPFTCSSPCQNPFPAGENELAGVVLTEGSGTPTPTPVVLLAPTYAPATDPAAAPSLDTQLFKQFMRAYLEV